jgi:hypothetical protein
VLLDGASVQAWLKKALPVENMRMLSRLMLCAAGKNAFVPNSSWFVVAPPGRSSPSSTPEPGELEHAGTTASESASQKRALAEVLGLAARGGLRLVNMTEPQSGSAMRVRP